MRQQRRSADEESIAKQEALKKQTLDYEYQMKTNLRQQELAMEKEQKEAL